MRREEEESNSFMAKSQIVGISKKIHEIYRKLKERDCNLCGGIEGRSGSEGCGDA